MLWLLLNLLSSLSSTGSRLTDETAHLCRRGAAHLLLFMDKRGPAAPRNAGQGHALPLMRISVSTSVPSARHTAMA